MCKAQGLIAIEPKTYVSKTTQSHPGLCRNPNLLLEEENLPKALTEVVVGDITYLPSEQYGYTQWIYLAIWMDLFSRRIVGWCIEEFMDEPIVIRAFESLLAHRQPGSGLIVHSDGGGNMRVIILELCLSNTNFAKA